MKRGRCSDAQFHHSYDSWALAATVCVAEHSKKGVDLSKAVIVRPFEAGVKGAVGLPDATRSAIIQHMKDEGSLQFGAYTRRGQGEG